MYIYIKSEFKQVHFLGEKKNKLGKKVLTIQSKDSIFYAYKQKELETQGIEKHKHA